jgi:hypothetical protein
MRNTFCFIFGAVLGIALPAAIAQTGMTVDQVEVQVQAILGRLDTLQTACTKTQATLANISGSNINSTQAQVNTLNGQVQSMNLQLSTVGALTQLGLDNAAAIKIMQGQIAALTPLPAAMKAMAAKPPVQFIQYQTEITKLRTDVNALKAKKK